MDTTIGTCSICGGPVRVPSAWWSVIPPTPRCAQCGATKASHGPVIDMQPSPRQRMFTTGGACLDIENHIDAVRKERRR